MNNFCKVPRINSLCLFLASLAFSAELSAQCNAGLLTAAEVAQVSSAAEIALDSKVSEFLGCLPTAKMPKTEPTKSPPLTILAYSKGKPLENTEYYLRHRVACTLATPANCTSPTLVASPPEGRDLVLKENIRADDLSVLLNYLPTAGILEGSVESIGYAASGETGWSLRKHGYHIVSRTSPTTGVDYVVSRSCGLFRACKWQLRNRTEWFQPCKHGLIDNFKCFHSIEKHIGDSQNTGPTAGEEIANHCEGTAIEKCFKYLAENPQRVLTALPNNPEYWRVFHTIIQGEPQELLPSAESENDSTDHRLELISAARGWVYRANITG